MAVFLGGACNPTTWRQSEAIPFLEKNSITYYNPQVDEWDDSLVSLEKEAKTNASILLFVLDYHSSNACGMLEVAYLAALGRKMVVVRRESPVNSPRDTSFPHTELVKTRAYLCDLVSCLGIPVFSELNQALKHILMLISNDKKKSETEQSNASYSSCHITSNFYKNNHLLGKYMYDELVGIYRYDLVKNSPECTRLSKVRDRLNDLPAKVEDKDEPDKEISDDNGSQPNISNCDKNLHMNSLKEFTLSPTFHHFLKKVAADEPVISTVSTVENSKKGSSDKNVIKRRLIKLLSFFMRKFPKSINSTISTPKQLLTRRISCEFDAYVYGVHEAFVSELKYFLETKNIRCRSSNYSPLHTLSSSPFSQAAALPLTSILFPLQQAAKQQQQRDEMSESESGIGDVENEDCDVVTNPSSKNSLISSIAAPDISTFHDSVSDSYKVSHSRWNSRPSCVPPLNLNIDTSDDSNDQYDAVLKNKVSYVSPESTSNLVTTSKGGINDKQDFNGNCIAQRDSKNLTLTYNHSNNSENYNSTSGDSALSSPSSCFESDGTSNDDTSSSMLMDDNLAAFDLLLFDRCKGMIFQLSSNSNSFIGFVQAAYCLGAGYKVVMYLLSPSASPWPEYNRAATYLKEMLEDHNADIVTTEISSEEMNSLYCNTDDDATSKEPSSDHHSSWREQNDFVELYSCLVSKINSCM